VVSVYHVLDHRVHEVCTYRSHTKCWTPWSEIYVRNTCESPSVRHFPGNWLTKRFNVQQGLGVKSTRVRSCAHSWY
jgi:hypothetical protein